MKKLGGNCGGMEKSRGAILNVSPAWWFSIEMKINLLWLTLSNPTLVCEYHQNRHQKVFKSFKVLLAENYLLHMSIKRTWTWIKHKTGEPSSGLAKNLGSCHTKPPFRFATEVFPSIFYTNWYFESCLLWSTFTWCRI